MTQLMMMLSLGIIIALVYWPHRHHATPKQLFFDFLRVIVIVCIPLVIRL